jgi:transposase
MTTYEPIFHIGIDISKATLDVFILPAQEYFQSDNTPEGMVALIERLSPYTSSLIVMESTGGYEKLATVSLLKAGFSVAVVNPKQIRDFAKASGQLAKTDRLDAKIIASFAQKLPPSHLASLNEAHDNLTEHHSRRQQLVMIITGEKSRLDKVSPPIRKSIERVITMLTEELETIEKVVETAIESEPAYQQKFTLLKSAKGIGEKTATALVLHLPELGTLSHKEVSALSGLAPFVQQSGKYKGQARIAGGRAMVRQALYMSTRSATRHNPAIRKFYERLRQAGKLDRVAMTACMHKLLIILNAMVRDNLVWNSAL